MTHPKLKRGLANSSFQACFFWSPHSWSNQDEEKSSLSVHSHSLAHSLDLWQKSKCVKLCCFSVRASLVTEEEKEESSSGLSKKACQAGGGEQSSNKLHLSAGGRKWTVRKEVSALLLPEVSSSVIDSGRRKNKNRTFNSHM